MNAERGPQAEETWNRLVGLATSWPATAAATSYGAPSLKVDGRMFARIRAEADDVLVFVSTPEERRAWLESEEPGLFTEPHYERYGHILADPSATDAAILDDLLDRAWELTAREKTRVARNET